MPPRDLGSAGQQAKEAPVVSGKAWGRKFKDTQQAPEMQLCKPTAIKGVLRASFKTPALVSHSLRRHHIKSTLP